MGRIRVGLYLGALQNHHDRAWCDVLCGCVQAYLEEVTVAQEGYSDVTRVVYASL